MEYDGRAAGCYDGIITINNDPSTISYYREGTINPDAHDLYRIVEHETDEVLGTASCIDTTGPTLAKAALTMK